MTNFMEQYYSWNDVLSELYHRLDYEDIEERMIKKIKIGSNLD